MRTKNFPRHKERRAEHAQQSNEAWRKLTIDQQLKELATRPGQSQRQVARLQRLSALGHTHVPQGGNPKPVPVQAPGDDTATKAPPKSDVKATKAFAKKQRKGEA